MTIFIFGNLPMYICSKSTEKHITSMFIGQHKCKITAGWILIRHIIITAVAINNELTSQ